MLSLYLLCCLLSLKGIVAESHYEVLGLAPALSESAGGPTAKEVQRAYRRAALLEHPDKSHRPDAEDRFRRVAAGFETLGNAARRAQYDYELMHGFSDSSHGEPGGQPMDPHEMFRNHVGDVWQHWQPGLRVEGDVLRGQERVHVVIYPDGTSEIGEAHDASMHRFQSLGEGWCVFRGGPQSMSAQGITEVACRRRCSDMRPGCEGYAFDMIDQECRIYKRSDGRPVPGKGDGLADVLCFHQLDDAFDTSSKVMERTVVVTQPDGRQSRFVTEIVCRTQNVNHHRSGLSSSPWSLESRVSSSQQVVGALTDVGDVDWGVSSWIAAFRRVAVALTGGGYHYSTI